jgi:membrane associated rhomboid family serine protease
MSYYRQENRRSRLTVGQDGNALITLISIQLVVFILLAFIKLIYFITYGKEGVDIMYPNNILDWVTLPANLSVFITRPWTLITHMFVHDSVWHIIANMLWLWGFGYILQDLAGNRKIIPIFIYGALAGALAYMLAFNLIPVFNKDIDSHALGASAGVMAIAIATTVMAPSYRIFPFINGGIPLWVLTMIFVIIDLATIPYNNPGGHIAHLAGAGMGFLFMFLLRKGYDWSIWMNNAYEWVNNLFNPEKPKKGNRIKTELFYKSSSKPYKKTSNITQQKIDDILDKINQKGYSSLTEDEKEILKRASKEDL